MSLIFHTKHYLFFALLLISILSFSQKNDTLVNKNTLKESFKERSQKLGYGSLNFSQPIPSNNSFIGQGMEGKIGFNLKALFFIHKKLFISGHFGLNYFTVTDKTIVGNYDKTRLLHQYISVGYQFLESPKFRSGFSISVYGESEFKNESSPGNSREALQYDSAKTRSYELYFDYMISDEFAVFLNYNYRNDKMNIKVSPDIQNLFNNASFHSIGLGVKLYFGQSDVLSEI